MRRRQQYANRARRARKPHAERPPTKPDFRALWPWPATGSWPLNVLLPLGVAGTVELDGTTEFGGADVGKGTEDWSGDVGTMVCEKRMDVDEAEDLTTQLVSVVVADQVSICDVVASEEHWPKKAQYCQLTQHISPQGCSLRDLLHGLIVEVVLPKHARYGNTFAEPGDACPG